MSEAPDPQVFAAYAWWDPQDRSAYFGGPVGIVGGIVAVTSKWVAFASPDRLELDFPRAGAVATVDRAGKWTGSAICHIRTGTNAYKLFFLTPYRQKQPSDPDPATIVKIGTNLGRVGQIGTFADKHFLGHQQSLLEGAEFLHLAGGAIRTIRAIGDAKTARVRMAEFIELFV